MPATRPYVRIRMPRITLVGAAGFATTVLISALTDQLDIWSVLMLMAGLIMGAEYFVKSIVVVPGSIIVQSWRRCDVIDSDLFVSLDRPSFFKHEFVLRNGTHWAPFSYSTANQRIADAIADLGARHVV